MNTIVNPFEALFKEIHLLRKCVGDLQKKLDEHLGANEKQFLTPTEYSRITGQNYKTVVDHCKKAKIKARQNGPNCGWLIPQSEVERYRTEAFNSK